MADDKDAEFAFDLFSDIAPLLALFGDQFARQFTSESLTWVDHLILAMVPLGILTVITGAIRVQGPRIAKSFIGRGRENRALAEIELMSSTSGEVCELFNGKSIIRVMGKPQIAQILVYPELYGSLKLQNEEMDRIIPDADAPKQADQDVSCGIHSFKTAALDEDAGRRLLSYQPYHSWSYQIMRDFVSTTRARLRNGPAQHLKQRREDDPVHEDDLSWLGPPNLQLGLSANQFEEGFPKKGQEIFIAAVTAVVLQAGLLAIATVTMYHQRTRQAIGFEPKSYGYPCYIAGSVLLSLGIAVCSLAVERNTVEYDWKVLTKRKAGDESAPGNSSVSMAQARKATSPRLLWLQQSQEVNDQAFDGYAILAGPKHHVITSSRIEDTEKHLNKKQPGNTDLHGHSKDKDTTTEKEVNDLNKPVASTHLRPEVWELITVCAVVAAGVGFVIQFMGLRGLTYPVSIAQLVAVFLMALVRAIIRRRLGRLPAYCPAFARYEVDYLATRLVYSRLFREYDEDLQKHIPQLGEQNPEQVFRFRVKTARTDGCGSFLYRSPKELRDAQSSDLDKGVDTRSMGHDSANVKSPSGSQRLSNKDSVNDHLALDDASCQQLLRVRQRLGDLTQWQSRALESAQSLVYSVEKFMDEFLPKRLDSFIWVVEAVGTKPSNGGNERSDYVNVPIRRSSKGKWQVDIGRIDAILSLWMASIESYTAATQVSKQRKSKGQIVGEDTQSNRALPDWRRSKAGVDMRYNYCRILGDDFEDGVLKRDIAWWVDELTAEQSDVRAKRKLDRSDEVPLDGLGTTMPTSHHKSETADTWECSNARAKAKSTDLVIGFNGREVDSKRSLAGERPRELAITSTGLLPTILAQHLFTSFMWTVVEQLPEDCLRQGVLSSEQDVEIDARHTFDPHEFVDTWRRPTLRHRQLTKLVRQLETFGLGTQNEVLLCMVPALSSRDLLPNHVILKLIPQIRHGQGWAETARCYNRLLEQSMRVAPRANMSVEKFCYNVVVATIDFLCFASEPYDEHISAPDELSTELEDIVARLVSARFATVVTKLAQAYILQRRNHDVERVLKLFGTPESFRRLDENEQLAVPFGGGEKLEACLEVYKLSKTRLDFMFLEKTLGLSRSLRPIYEALSGMPQSESTDQPPMPQFYSSAAKTHDIFDWTPLHYASFLEDRSLLWRYFEPKQVRKHLSIHKTLGPFGRTPVHMAAISGSRAAMQWISKCLANTEDKKNAFEMVGLDGMSPLHLATKTGNHYMIEKMVRKRRIRATTSIDFWRRAAIHLAASHGHHGIATILLKDAQLDAVDDIGKTPLEYLLKNRGELQDTEEPKTDTTATLDDGKTAEDGLDGLGDGKDAVQGVADALHDKRDVTLEMISAEQPEPPEADTDIRSEQNLDDETSEVSSIKKREAAEQKRKIFLEFASRRSEYRDEKGRTFLYHAIEYTDVNTIEQLLSTGYKLEFQDTNGYTPLHFALWTDRPKVAIRLLQGLASQTADPSVKDEQGCTALMFAAMSGHINVVRFLVERESSSRQEAPATTEDTVKESEIDSSENAPKSSAEAYGTVATSSSGRTALHMALEYSQEEVALYLLNLPEGQVQVESCDSGRNTLLVTACRSILLSDSCKSTILEKWPRDINQPDSIYGQTPLSFACELGSSSVVDMLLAYDTLDINKPAKDWGDYTPLQAAVMNERASIVKKLLCQKSIDVNAKNSYGQTAVDMAGSNAEVAQVLLTHEQVDSKTRLSFMSQCCRSANQAVQEILPDILTLVSDGDITDKELIDLVYTSEESRSIVPHAAFVRRAFGRDTWKSIVHPYHKVARIGSLELADVLKEYGSDPTDLDDDGWSCIEYAETYQGSSLDAGLLRALQTAAAKPGDISKIKPPAALRYTHVESCVSLNSCKEAGHKDCDGIHALQVTEAYESTRVNIRTTTCVPPLSEHVKSFYFEVTILKESDSRLFGVGFCDKNYYDNQMPGWYDMSFAYHGDDGGLFISVGFGRNPTTDFGTRGTYGVGDTVGAGLNLETGEGFFTLNGKRKDAGDAFADVKFKGRKLYPCVGYDGTEDGIGLRFETNLGLALKAHPFKYKGFTSRYGSGMDDEELDKVAKGAIL